MRREEENGATRGDKVRKRRRKPMTREREREGMMRRRWGSVCQDGYCETERQRLMSDDHRDGLNRTKKQGVKLLTSGGYPLKGSSIKTPKNPTVKLNSTSETTAEVFPTLLPSVGSRRELRRGRPLPR